MDATSSQQHSATSSRPNHSPERRDPPRPPLSPNPWLPPLVLARAELSVHRESLRVDIKKRCASSHQTTSILLPHHPILAPKRTTEKIRDTLLLLPSPLASQRSSRTATGKAGVAGLRLSLSTFSLSFLPLSPEYPPSLLTNAPSSSSSSSLHPQLRPDIAVATASLQARCRPPPPPISVSLLSSEVC
jgi:hypothetical protein